MADDEGRDRPAPDDADAPRSRDEAGLDETSEQPRLDDDTMTDGTPVDGTPVDGQGVEGPVLPRAPPDDATQVAGTPVDATQVAGTPVDATQPDDATLAAGTSAETASGPPAVPRWSARAQVPQRADEEEMVPGWDGPPPRSFAVPVLIITCVLLLLALVGLAVWLVARGRDGGPTTPPTVTSTPTTPFTSATSGPPTTPTTTPPPTTAPALVAIPNLRGQPADAAAGQLTGLGLVPERRDQASTEVEDGLVIGTDPGAESNVAPGTRVILIVSTGPPEPTGGPTTPGPTETA